MNTKFTKRIGLLVCAVTTGLTHAAVTPQVDYLHDGATDAAFTSTSNTGFSTGDVYVFYGTFDSIPTVNTPAQDIEDSFNQLGLTSNDNPYSGHTYSSSVSEGDFEGRRGYLVVSNNADIGLATEMAIISNSSDSNWTFAADLSGVPATQTVRADHAFTSGGEIIIGEADTHVAYSNTIKLEALVPVPEPSSSALLGLGFAALLLRRRK